MSESVVLRRPFESAPGLPRTMVLTAYNVISPVTGLCCHRRLRSVSGPLGLTTPFRKLDASVGASRPYDFAVRFGAVRQWRIHVHRIPLRVRDDRETPL